MYIIFIGGPRISNVVKTARTPEKQGHTFLPDLFLANIRYAV